MHWIEPDSKSVVLHSSRLTPDLWELPHRVLDGDMVAFPHREYETAQLRKIDPTIPSPIRTYYNWPGPFKPYEHQMDMAEHMTMLQRAFCFGDIGVGKTASTIWAMLWAMLMQGIRRVLIIGPKSTMWSVWKNELYRLAPMSKVEIVHGARQKRLETLARDSDIFIINPDSVWRYYDELAAKDFDLVIVDEQTVFKTPSANRTKAIQKLVAKPSIRVWMLSGEPMPEAPTDLYIPARIVCPDRVPRTAGRFKDLTMYQVSRWKWVPRKNVEQTIKDMIGDYAIRYDRDDCVDLPETSYGTATVEPTTQQAKMTLELKREAAIIMDEGVITAVHEAALMLKLLQISCGAVKMEDTDEVLPVDCASKFEALEDVIQATHGPILLFAPFIAVLDMLEKWIRDRKIPYARVDGSVGMTARKDAFQAVQDSEVKILLANPAAMSHGITLTAANVIVWWGLPYGQEVYNQANGRIVRVSQTRKTYILHIVATEIEQRVLARLKDKQKMQGLLLDILKGGQQ